MLELLPAERLLFMGILILSGMSSILACWQIIRDDPRPGNLLTAFTTLQIGLGAVLLIFRAAAIKGFPLTGVFESMIILMVFVGMTFLFMSAYLRQVWFRSIMAWVLFVIAILAAVVARPASVLQEAARTPWAAVHALSMVLAAAMIVFAAAMSVLFLWSRKRLKSPKFLTLLGRMPTIDKLEDLNLLGLKLSFAALTFGLISGIGLAAVKSAGLEMTPGDWLSDSKIVLVIVAWIILLVTLILRRLLVFSGFRTAQAALAVCFLILFAFIGSKVFCKSGHDFGSPQTASTPAVERSYADPFNRN